jgi:hypothetical protein
MAIVDYWAEAPRRRQQMTLFAPKLDDHIGPDHPVRLFDELLGSMDWSAWEAEYDGRRGQPPSQMHELRHNVHSPDALQVVYRRLRPCYFDRSLIPCQASDRIAESVRHGRQGSIEM